MAKTAATAAQAIAALVGGSAPGKFDTLKHPHGAGGKFSTTPDAVKKAQDFSATASIGKTSGIKAGDYLYIHATSNPKQAGSKSAERFAHYPHGGTVQDYVDNLVKAGHTKKDALADVAWDIKKGFVSVVDKAEADSTVKSNGGSLLQNLKEVLQGKPATSKSPKVPETPPAPAPKPKPSLDPAPVDIVEADKKDAKSLPLAEAKKVVKENAESGKTYKIGGKLVDGNSVLQVAEGAPQYLAHGYGIQHGMTLQDFMSKGLLSGVPDVKQTAKNQLAVVAHASDVGWINILPPGTPAHKVGVTPPKTGPVVLKEANGKEAGTVDRADKLSLGALQSGNSKPEKKSQQAHDRFKDGQTVQEFFDSYPGGEAAAAPVLAHYKNWGVVKVAGAPAPKSTTAAKTPPPKVEYPAHWFTDKPADFENEPDRWSNLDQLSLGHTTPNVPKMLAIHEKQGINFYKKGTPGVDFYTGTGYRGLNSKLRQGISPNAGETAHANQLLKLINSSKTKEDSIMWRGVGGKGGINDLPPPEFFDDKGIISMSYNPKVSSNFGGSVSDASQRALLRVRVPKGTPMAMISRRSTLLESMRDEAECIVAPGTKFVVVGHSVMNNRKIIDVQIVP